jgi:hypothetical protein
MSTTQTSREKKDENDPALPIGQREGEGTNEIRHEPDPSADPIPDGEHRYMPRTGYIHGND